METIRVNMTPCEDVQTIHASQNDNEAREWGFELHNNGDKIDSSSISDQLVFKAYEGGTEQILPENGSTPTTSPFIGDIRYPQGLLSDQEFTYRQSPTEEDGLAKITDIKGNTLVWNQLVQNGNFANGTDNWSGASATLSASNGELTVTIGGAWNNDARQNLSLVAGHKYLGCFKVKSDTLTNGVIFGQFGTQANVTIARATALSPTYQTIVGIATINEPSSSIRCTLSGRGSSYIGQSYIIKDVNIFDLTQMGLDSITEPSEFISIFPLPYYDYNAETLLSFNGTGLKSASEDESKEDTLALPVATYFPTGMKSVNTVYDELTPTKAITRVGKVDLGSLSWNYDPNSQNFRSSAIEDIKPSASSSSVGNAICDRYLTVNYHGLSNDKTLCIIWEASPATKTVYIKDLSYSDATAFKTAMDGVYLYYELATPTETSFTTASLVTENTEIPLSNEDGVLIGKCTEQLSSDSGFFDAKIKLSDEDGECYSNKLQLHIERSPQ